MGSSGFPEELSTLSRVVRANAEGQWIINLISMTNGCFPAARSWELKQMRPPEEEGVDWAGPSVPIPMEIAPRGSPGPPSRAGSRTWLLDAQVAQDEE